MKENQAVVITDEEGQKEIYRLTTTVSEIEEHKGIFQGIVEINGIPYVVALENDVWRGAI